MRIKGTKKEQRRVRRALRRLPTKIRDLLESEGISFEVRDRRATDYYKYGRFDYDAKLATIYRQPWFHFGLSEMSTAIHEAGHGLDQAVGALSATPEFVAAHREDWKYLRGYEKQAGPAESFADTVVAIWGPRWARRFLGKRPALKRLVREALL